MSMPLLRTDAIPARVGRLLERAALSNKPRDVLVQRAEEMGILPTFLRYFAEKDSDFRGFTEKSAGVLGRLALNKVSLQKVCKAIDVPNIVLKGVALGERLYGSALNRETQDIDLWLPLESIKSATASLEGMGYVPAREAKVWASNQRAFFHPVLAPVELHWALLPAPIKTPSFDFSYRRALDYEIADGFSVKVLDDEMQWMHLLLHAHQHLFAFKPMLDLAAGCEQFGGSTLLQDYGLDGLDQFWRSLIVVWTQMPLAGCFVDARQKAFFALLARYYLDALMDKRKWGNLVFGEHSDVTAALGVLSRALSMFLLDGWRYRAEAFMSVLFYGPHRVGALLNRMMDETSLHS